ncbi:gypsy type transposase [Tanacetum coccineum]|uniref:Gypsy type transposase n=1 Tax=Tanacetum coccineum TaxID=301880 RepID=A0ABQ5ACV4_9ASTR
MGTIDSMKSVLTESALDALCERFHIHDVVHPELPGRYDRIRNSPVGKIGVYSRFFDFANYRIPLSQFVVDILAYFQINLSQLSVIAAAKVSHFEILCRVHGFVPTVDSLKNWNDHFFWVDGSIFPLIVTWHSDKTLRKDPHPTPIEFNADVCNYLADNHAPFRKLLEPFLCFVGISRYYDLDENCYPTFWANVDEMDMFAFINHADPTKVRIGEREVTEGEVPLLQLTRGRVVPLAGVNDQVNVNVQGAGNDDVNEEGSNVTETDQTHQNDHVVQIGGIDIAADDEAQAIVADKLKKLRKKRKAADGASGSGLPPKKLREDHSTSGDAGASTAGKSVAALQGLLASSTLAVEVSATATATIPFVTSSVTPTPEREDGGPTNSIFVANLLTQHPTKRFVISSDTPHDFSTNAADDEVSFVVRSLILDPAILTTAVATTVVADTSAPVPRAGHDLVHHTLFADSTSIGEANPDTAEALQQAYVPKWAVINDSTLDDPDSCRTARQTCLSSEERDADISSLKAQLSLKEAEATKAIRLRGQIATIEAAKAARIAKLNGLKEQATTLRDRIEEGTFLGYKVNTEGIMVCPEKVGAVLKLPSPKCIKDVQKLNGKLASLNRFLSKLAEKSLPFFKTTKKCTKKSDFQWTTEDEAAFKEMKKLITELPTLTAPMEREELTVYLAAAREAASAVLMTEREAKQMPVYFASRTMQGSHNHCHHRPTNQADTVVRQEVAGRLQKWSIELGEYDIQYRPRTSVKGKILADFIMERLEDDPLDTPMEAKEELPDSWTLFTDESSYVDGFGAGLILTNPEGAEFTYALRFRFDATNNEAEYEALIAGLRIIEQIGVKNLKTK